MAAIVDVFYANVVHPVMEAFRQANIERDVMHAPDEQCGNADTVVGLFRGTRQAAEKLAVVVESGGHGAGRTHGLLIFSGLAARETVFLYGGSAQHAANFVGVVS